MFKDFKEQNIRLLSDDFLWTLPLSIIAIKQWACEIGWMKWREVPVQGQSTCLKEKDNFYSGEYTTQN